MKKSSTIFRKNGVLYLKAFGKYENITRGTTEFPAEYYDLYDGHINYIMKYHWHMDWEIIKVNSGSLKITLNEHTVDLRENDILLVPGGILHGGEPENCLYECIVFDSSVLFGPGRYIKNIIRNSIKSAVLIRLSENEEIYLSGKKLFSYLKDKQYGYEVVSSGALNMFLGEIIKNNLPGVSHTETEVGNKRIDNIKEALKLIENEYSSPDITLERLSRTCGMSPRYFCEFFKGMTGHTPIDYLNRYRIESACNMLALNGMNVTETALSCGFNDISYFIRTFKKYTGITPKQYCLKNRIV